MATQLITPNPDVPCRPGWCLEYVRTSFGLPARYNSATEAWEASPSKHEDWVFPDGCWVPLWFSIGTIPEGHVALRAPDGSVYSSSDLTNIPHHHPSIADLIDYYARLGKLTLTYLGWSEDVAGFPVVTPDTISVQGSITIQEDDMPTADEVAAAVWNFDYKAGTNPDGTDRMGKPLWMLQSMDAIIRETIQKTAAATAQVLLSTELHNVRTGGTTTPGAEISWNSQNVQAILDAIKGVESQPPGEFDQAKYAADLTTAINTAVAGLTITLTTQNGASNG